MLRCGLIGLRSCGKTAIFNAITAAGVSSYNNNEMNEAIVNYVRLKYSLLMGEPTAEDVKISIGTLIPGKDEFFVVRGRDLETGLPKSLKLTSSEVREALSEVTQEIVANIVDTLEETPPELVSDIMEKGITLAGGGSLLKGIDKVVSEATKMPAYVAEDPMGCVVRGCGVLLEKPNLLQNIRITKGI